MTRVSKHAHAINKWGNDLIRRGTPQNNSYALILIPKPCTIEESKKVVDLIRYTFPGASIDVKAKQGGDELLHIKFRNGDKYRRIHPGRVVVINPSSNTLIEMYPADADDLFKLEKPQTKGNQIMDG